MAVRLPVIQRVTKKIDKERRWLPSLALLPLAIPLPLAKGTPAEGYPFAWSIYPWLKAR